MDSLYNIIYIGNKPGSEQDVILTLKLLDNQRHCN
jgi:hypothetical protein